MALCLLSMVADNYYLEDGEPIPAFEAVSSYIKRRRDNLCRKYGFGHTAMIQFGRDYCTARKPACLDDPEACPLVDLCDQVGVDTAEGEVVDPSETVAD